MIRTTRIRSNAALRTTHSARGTKTNDRDHPFEPDDAGKAHEGLTIDRVFTTPGCTRTTR